MGNLFLDKIKKQASYFLHEKYKTARLLLTDATQAELLTEDVTNNDVSTPDNITMNLIAEASYEIEDYWKIVDVLHRRLDEIDWIQWRQSYKTLVLLEFLIIHGPQDLAAEFLCDLEIIRELGSFKYKDERGLDWGQMMQRKSERILILLQDDVILKESRHRAQRLSSEIQGFGNSTSAMTSSSPLSSTSSSSSPSSPSWSSSLGSNSSSSDDTEETTNKEYEYESCNNGVNVSPLSPYWSGCYNRKEKTTLLVHVGRGDVDEDDDVEEGEKDGNFVSRLCSRFGISPRGNHFRYSSIKDNKKLFRNFSRR